ncbi:uncharacterized protein DUF4367 [Ureibacillus xyleni]|uniref:Uncharacterized protein DUF4367 n=1 Tax=Ureibacillus xyleni TaxID=614648 RepID=A0A285T280_9BACL|nr:DUF4367 domain-containing protein [Ureibacillus xyleni]SOC15429.1 uncharacterized protein DUF4367 [Ureibacillus xyleni]
MLLKIIAIVTIFFTPFVVQAKEIKYNHDSITVSEVKEKVDFPVFVPEKTPTDWTLEIKTYPIDEENFTHFRLHYMDKDDTILKVGIEQRKGSSNKGKFLSPNAEEVDINANKGIFSSWGNSGEVDTKGELITGGLLLWTQDGTSIEMNSSRIPKEIMLEIARSMKVVK